MTNNNKLYGDKTPVSPLRRFWNASRYSLKGIKTSFRFEQAFRMEVYALLIAIPAALFLGQTGLERLMLIASVVLVLIVELLNTGVEMVVDRIGLEHHELSGRAKDAGSAAVFISILLSASVWITVLSGAL